MKERYKDFFYCAICVATTPHELNEGSIICKKCGYHKVRITNEPRPDFAPTLNPLYPDKN